MTRKSFKQIAGYTLDQMILIVAIIAILVTIVILSIGWSIINRSSGAKLAAQFKQIEDANGQFYSANRVWPHQAYTGAVNSANNILALTGSGVTYQAAVTDPKNFITGFGRSGSNITHNFTNTGNIITMAEVTNPFNSLTGTYLVVQFRNVPLAEVLEAEMAIDGGDLTSAYAGLQNGRVVGVVGAAGNCLIAGTPGAVATSTSRGAAMTACYAANLVQ